MGTFAGPKLFQGLLGDRLGVLDIQTEFIATITKGTTIAIVTKIQITNNNDNSSSKTTITTGITAITIILTTIN